MTPPNSPQVQAPDWRPVTVLVAALTLARLVALFTSPLELYPDEAQYWLWSRTLDFGYYSKPPVIAWAIWATTALGGDTEPWVRLSAVMFQAGATLMVFTIGQRLFGATTGLVAAALYGLMPGIQLSALVAATDAPLLFALSLSLYAYVRFQAAEGRARIGWAAALGAAMGLALLSKYAAAFYVVGLALHLVMSRPARAAWTPAAAMVALSALVAMLAPNLAWNARHGFATFRHTADNAAWSGVQLFNPAEVGAFLISQFGVFGPVPMGVLIVGIVLAWRRKAMTGDELILACFTLPPLAIVTVQAFVSRANANWSGAAYLAGAILAAHWLVRWRARRWLIAALAIQALVAAVFLAGVTSPALADRMGLANGLKRARGWSQTTDLILDRAALEPGLSAIAVNNRFLFYAISYYGRDRLGPGAPPLTSWLLMDGPRNQAETTAPLTTRLGARVLMVSYEGWRRTEMQADFARSTGLEIVSVGLDRRHKRKVEMFVGEGFNPRLRDPVSGRPTPP